MTGKDSKKGQHKPQASGQVNTNGNHNNAHNNVQPQGNNVSNIGFIQGHGGYSDQGNVQSLQNLHPNSNFQSQNQPSHIQFQQYQQQGMNSSHGVPIYDQGANQTSFLGQLHNGSPSV